MALEMKTMALVNTTGSPVTITDLGITIAASGSLNIEDQFEIYRIMCSDDLRDLVNAGTISVNTRTGSDGVNELYISSKYERLNEHYTKTQIQTSGQSVVHWDNITGAPSFGSPTWVDPVKCKVLSILSDPGSLTPSENDFYVDTDDDHLYKYVSSSWVDQGAVASGDRFIKLDEADEAIFEYSGSSYDDQGAPVDNEGVNVADDGDGKQAQYAYQLSSTSWKKIGDYDFGPHLNDAAGRHNADQIAVEGTYTNLGSPTDVESALSALDTDISNLDGHLDGGDSKHDASEIDVEGSYTNLSGSDVEEVFSNLDTTLSSLDTQNTLDEAYDEGGAGAGKDITADSGAVAIDASGGTNAPLELVPQSTPTTDIQPGQIFIDSTTGMPFYTDTTRSNKMLSMTRETYAFGRKAQTKNQYINIFNGETPSNLGGIRVPANATIVSISCQLEASGTCTVEIRKDDGGSAIASLAVSGAAGAQAFNTNVDVSAGEALQCYVSATTAVQAPTVLVGVAFRK